MSTAHPDDISDDTGSGPERLAVTADPTEQAGAENFPVALKVLPAAPRRHLMAIYGYARMVDDIGDEYTGDRIARLDAVEQELRGLYAGRPAKEQVLRELAPTIEACGIPAEVLVRLIEANRVDQVVARYATFDQLADYCTLSANPVGELVLYVFGRHTPTRVALSDRICTALQIIEHLQDVAEDHRAGRVYLPQEDLDRFGVTEADLAAPRANAALRDLVAYQAERAAAWLSAGEPLLYSLHGFARLAVTGYAAGGRAALAALARSGYDPLPGPPKASKAMVVGALLRTTFGRRA
ncbi:phytoene synthase [Actinocatenispora thailandica]|uniref:Phytoene synthase n=1 Tax=Actinocatenispora thailandica TaxID=227318 RepID=A0A7R7HZQ3_9ACTN|nr:squalene synthase HpnC [Actinocatenispora thailandica]BCJ37609.1 phytoene synthase [Actinocatenispora thailandica]